MFDDLQFSEFGPGMVRAKAPFENGYAVSVIEIEGRPFELAVLDHRGELIDCGPLQEDTNIVEELTPTEVSELMLQVQAMPDGWLH